MNVFSGLGDQIDSIYIALRQDSLDKGLYSPQEFIFWYTIALLWRPQEKYLYDKMVSNNIPQNVTPLSYSCKKKYLLRCHTIWGRFLIIFSENYIYLLSHIEL